MIEKINLCEFEKLFLNSQHLQFLHSVPKISKLLNIKSKFYLTINFF